MRVVLLQGAMAGPNGTANAGDIIELPDVDAKRLIRDRQVRPVTRFDAQAATAATDVLVPEDDWI